MRAISWYMSSQAWMRHLSPSSVRGTWLVVDVTRDNTHVHSRYTRALPAFSHSFPPASSASADAGWQVLSGCVCGWFACIYPSHMTVCFRFLTRIWWSASSHDVIYIAYALWRKSSNLILIYIIIRLSI